MSPVLRDFYAGKRVLITGHTGFKGSWLTLWLRSMGAQVAGYALEPNTDPALFDMAGLADAEGVVQHSIADIRDLQKLVDTFRAFEPEIAFHLAAQPLVRLSYREPKETFDVNVGGTVNFLEAVRQTPSVRVSVVITTDKVYENREWTYGYREVDPLGGHDPYSASKAAAEMVVASYRKAFFSTGGAARPVGVAAVRAGNVIGGGDWALDRILPDAFRAAQAGKDLEVRHPEAIRPWQHVLEPLGGYLCLGLRLWEAPDAFSGAWNFGPLATDVMRVGELVEAFYRAYERGRWIHVPPEDGSLHEAGLLKLACDKAHDELGWEPVWDTGEAVRTTALWYRDVMEHGMDAAARCRSDIDTYLAAAAARGDWWA